MTRKKVKLQYITNDSARKATFKKRKKGLLKKVTELSTLCGIEAGAIIYSPYDTQPEVWPSPMGIQSVLGRFKNMPEMDQSKKMVNQESFIRQRIAKAHDQLKKQRKDNREKEMTQVMYQGLVGKSLASLNMMDLNDIGWLVDHYLKEIQKKHELIIQQSQGSSQPPPPPTPTPPPPPPSSQLEGMLRTGAGEIGGQLDMPAAVAAAAAAAGFEMNSMDNMQRQWFMDMMNAQEPMAFAGDDMILPFGGNPNNGLWHNGFLP